MAFCAMNIYPLNQIFLLLRTGLDRGFKIADETLNLGRQLTLSTRAPCLELFSLPMQEWSILLTV